MSRVYTKVGDILEIPLPNNKKAFAQFIFKTTFGNVIKVYEIIESRSKKSDITMIYNSNSLFPPVLTLVRAAIKFHGWKKIGNMPVKEKVKPKFVNGWPGRWFLWDGEHEIRLGEKVPEQYHDLEYEAAYSPDLIANRIVTGIKPYGEMISMNITPKGHHYPDGVFLDLFIEKLTSKKN